MDPPPQVSSSVRERASWTLPPRLVVQLGRELHGPSSLGEIVQGKNFSGLECQCLQ